MIKERLKSICQKYLYALIVDLKGLQKRLTKVRKVESSDISEEAVSQGESTHATIFSSSHSTKTPFLRAFSSKKRILLNKSLVGKDPCHPSQLESPSSSSKEPGDSQNDL
ncbi:hypothetical protein FNV43_RR05545 [Rhamnella rubrinervis]|uniref:Uncharacterized protein n=1 Tax=Rhamnella rubrinervis TaxID=2594499 RepID=A0A8K0HLS4_9ROSA|nr:hypothetical protein FNV43_RR05545 [Rhamnella rubrinervis]